MKKKHKSKTHQKVITHT